MDIWYAPIFDKRFKKLPRKVQKKIIEEIKKLENDPEIGEPLIGDLKGIRSLHVKVDRTHYRVIYRISKRTNKIIVIVAGKHRIYDWIKHYLYNVLKTTVERAFEP